jgi:hypothetical protein
MDTLDGEFFSFFSKNQSFNMVLTLCVALSCLSRLSVLWPQCNVIISKSKTHLELKG